MFNEIQKVIDRAVEKTQVFKTIKVTEGEPQKEYSKIFTVTDIAVAMNPWDHKPFKSAFRKALVSIFQTIVNEYKAYTPQSIDQPKIDALRDFMTFDTANGVRFFFKELPDMGNGSAFVVKTFLSIGPRGEAKKSLFGRMAVQSYGQAEGSPDEEDEV